MKDQIQYFCLGRNKVKILGISTFKGLMPKKAFKISNIDNFGF